MPLPGTEENLFQDDPTKTGGAPTGGADPQPNDGAQPPQDDPIQDPRVQLAIEKAKNETLQDVLRNGNVQRQDDPTRNAAPAQVVLPNDPLDLLTPGAKAQMESLLISDPVGYGKEYARLAAQLERAKLEQQAAPLVSSQASTFVELFKAKMARTNPNLAPQIEPLFDASLNGLDLRPLVQMTPQARESELMLRWNAAKAQVLEKNIQNTPAPRPEPRLQAGGGGIDGGGGTKKTKIEEDGYLSRMNDAYKFTPEQLAAIEAEL